MQPTDPSKFTDKAWEAIVQSQDVVRRYKHQNLEAEHLLIALLEQSDGLVVKQRAPAQAAAGGELGNGQHLPKLA